MSDGTSRTDSYKKLAEAEDQVENGEEVLKDLNKNLLFGDWKKDFTEEGIKMVNEISDALRSGDKNKFNEVFAGYVVEMRDDFTKEQIIGMLE